VALVGDTGVVVPPENPVALAVAIRTLASESPGARRERGIRARARIVENFAMPQAIQRYVELYASLEPARR
jgi:glycosyltransferase involved in cell wall biosynthesis